jgi:hypothetical protein
MNPAGQRRGGHDDAAPMPDGDAGDPQLFIDRRDLAQPGGNGEESGEVSYLGDEWPGSGAADIGQTP